MCQLKLVKTARHQAEVAAAQNNNNNAPCNPLPHGAQVLQELVRPWIRSQRIVCADSYFASVAAALDMKRLGLRFIGVVKTATSRYPVEWLSRKELVARGDRKGLVSHGTDGHPELLPFVWLDLPEGGEGVFLLEERALSSHTARR